MSCKKQSINRLHKITIFIVKHYYVNGDINVTNITHNVYVLVLSLKRSSVKPYFH